MIQLLALFVSLAQAETGVESLQWMAGCWQLQSPNGSFSIEEQWMKPAGQTMLGAGRTIRNGVTLFTEFQKISVEDGKLTYTARIGTKGTTLFPLLKLTADEVIFENPTHDFPQRILYRKAGNGLFARIEGVEKGKEKHQDFPYKRVSCE